MKCIRCGTNNTRRDRTTYAGKCRSCRHSFVFDPDSTRYELKNITDVYFQNILNKVSANQTLYFTANQLFYALNRKLGAGRSLIPRFGAYFSGSPPNNLSYIISVLIATAWLGGILNGILGILGYAVVFVVATVLALNIRSKAILQYQQTQEQRGRTIAEQRRQTQEAETRFRKGQFTRPLIMTRKEFEVKLIGWEAINGPVQKLLTLLPQTSSRASSNPDVTAYSFDRLVVCQSDRIAQLLIANNFHFENNCAVLSINGYPQPIFETVMQMVRRNPDLKVYAFHDCSLEGIGLIPELQTNERWFQGSEIAIIDAGLRPRQVIQTARNSRSDREAGLFVEQSAESAELAQQQLTEGRLSTVMLSEEELEWLTQGYFVVLESFTPQKLIQVLTRSISSTQQLEPTDDSRWLMIDSYSSVYAIESFG